jgi:hypothetical protein
LPSSQRARYLQMGRKTQEVSRAINLGNEFKIARNEAEGLAVQTSA